MKVKNQFTSTLRLLQIALYIIFAPLSPANSSPLPNKCSAIFSGKGELLRRPESYELPSERLARVSQRSRGFWRKLSADFQFEVRGNIEKELNSYLNMKRLGHPQIRFLELLGFQFAPQVQVPSLIGIFDKLESLAINRARQNGSAAEAAFFPKIDIQIGTVEVSTFLDQVHERFRPDPRYENGVTQVPFGSELPEGARFLPSNSNIATDFDFVRRYAAGIFSIGSPDRINGARAGAVSVAEHDLAHLGAILDPSNQEQAEQYEQAIRKGFAGLVESGRYPDPTTETGLWRRVFHVSETLVVFQPEKAKSIRQYLDLPQRPENNIFFTEDEIVTHLKTLSSEQISNLVERLRSQIWRYLYPLGGAERDGISIQAFTTGRRQFPLDTLVENLPKDLTARTQWVSEYQNIARMELYVWELSRLSVSEIVTAAFKKNLDPSDQGYRLFHLLGFTSDSLRDARN